MLHTAYCLYIVYVPNLYLAVSCVLVQMVISLAET